MQTRNLQIYFYICANDPTILDVVPAAFRRRFLQPQTVMLTWPLGGGDELGCFFFFCFPDLIPPEQRSGMGTSSRLFMRSRPPPMKCELSASLGGREGGWRVEGAI